MKTTTITKITKTDSDNQLIKLWLSTNKSKTTQSTYKTVVKQFLNFIGKKLIGTITLEDMINWREYLESKYKPATVRGKLAAIKSLLTFGHKIGYLKANVGLAIAASKIQGKNNLTQRYLPKSDLDRFFSAIDNQQHKILFSLIFGCGLRISEALSLTWEDISYNSRGRLKITVFGKGKKTRVVLVPKKLDSLVLRLKKINLNKSDRDPIFQSRSGKRIDRTRAHRLIKKYLAKAGLNTKASCHWLRHSFATIALENGCDLHLLQRTLGHSSLAITSIYLHANPDKCASDYI